MVDDVQRLHSALAGAIMAGEANQRRMQAAEERAARLEQAVQSALAVMTADVDKARRILLGAVGEDE